MTFRPELFAAAVLAAVLLDLRKRRREEKALTASPRRFPKLNFAFDIPPGFRLQQRKSDDEPELIMHSGDVTLSVMGWASTANYLNSPAIVANRRIQAIDAACENHRELQREPLEVAGHVGVMLSVEAKAGSTERRYVSFCRTHRGFEHEILLHAPAGKLSLAEAQALLRDSIPRLTILEPEAAAYARFPPFADEHRSRFAYRWRPLGAGWRRWDRLATDEETAEFGLFHEDGGILVLFPIVLPSGTISLDAITAGLLSLYSFRFPEEGLLRTAEEIGANRAWRNFKRVRANGDNRYEYRLHVVRWPHHALLLVYCAEPANPTLDQRFQEALGGLTLLDDSPALATADFTESDLARHLRAYQQIGEALIKTASFDAAAAVHDQRLAMKPDDAQAMFDALLARTRGQRLADALDLYRLHAARFASDLKVRGFEPYLLKRLGQLEQSRTAFEKLFADGGRATEDIDDHLELLLEARDFTAATAMLRTCLAEGDRFELRRSLARVHRVAGDHDAAIDELRPAADKEPLDVAANVALAHEYSHAKRFPQALAVCDRLAERGHQGATVHFARGIAEHGLEWYRQAQQSFANALELDPHDQSYRNWWEHAGRQLGEGSNRSIREAIEPVDLPPVAVDVDSSAFPEHPVVYLEDTRAMRFRRGVDFRCTERVVFLIRSATGAERMSTYRLRYDPEVESLFVNELRVRDARGATRHVGRVEDYFVKDETPGDADTKKLVSVPVPGLEPGCRVELTVTRRRHGAPTAFPGQRVDLGFDLPVMRATLEVSGDLDGLRVRTAGELVESAGPPRRFVAAALDGYVREPFLVARYHWRPTVWLGEATHTWHQVTHEYLDRIADRLVPTPTTDALAARLTEGLVDDESKASALADFVRRELSYKSIAFGPRGYVPEAPDEVLRARFGDCKGLSALFRQLMVAAGVPCHLALVHTDDLCWPEVPDRWQFNHMINWCPSLGNGRFIDCVDRGLSSRAAAPNGLAGRGALILDREQPHLREIAAYPSDANRVHITREVRIGADDDLQVEDSLAIDGNLASYMRRWLQHHEGQAQREHLQRLLHDQDPRIDLIDLAPIDPLDFAAPCRVRMRYRVRGAVETLDGRRLTRLVAPWERDYLLPTRVHSRKTPFEIEMPYLLEATVAVRGADGFLPRLLEGAAASGTDAWLEWHREVSRRDDGIDLVFHVRQRAGRHPATAYAGFCDASQRVLERAELRLALEATPQPPVA